MKTVYVRVRIKNFYGPACLIKELYDRVYFDWRAAAMVIEYE